MSTEQTEKRISTRVVSKHGLASEWALATNFKPLKGEIIVYDPDDTYDHARIKVGDGENIVDDLPFAATYDLTAPSNKTNGNVTINLTASGSTDDIDSITIKGAGATSVTTDANGVVTISSTDTNTETTLTIDAKEDSDTDDIAYALIDLQAGGEKGHDLTPIYRGLPTKAYVDKMVTGTVEYLGTVSALTELSLTAGQGDFYRVSTQFAFGSETAHVGDILLATKDNPTRNTSDWDLIHTEVDSNTWTANSSTADGYVAKTNGAKNHVWKTDDNGVPAWREDIPITAGAGEGSLVINEGDATGETSIAGGTTDTELIASILGDGYKALLEKFPDITKIPDSIISLILDLTDSDLTVAEFKQLLAISPSTAEGMLSISLGTSNKSLAAGSTSLGFANISGAKGYYISDINTGNRTITLSTKQNSNVAPTNGITWASGDIIFVTNDERYFLTIESVSGRTVTVTEPLPFSSLAELKILNIIIYGKYDLTNPNERSIININKPEDGEVVFGWGAIGIGTQNTVVGSNAYGVGYQNIVAGDFAAAFGQENIVGYSAFATGVKNEALAKASFAEGTGTTASGLAAHSEGEGTVASGSYAHAEGLQTNAIGKHSHAENYTTKTYGEGSHAEGGGTETGTEQNPASGLYAHAEGQTTKAHGVASHTEGHNTETTASYAHAEGEDSVAAGLASHAEGYDTDATGYASHAEGQGTTASKSTAHAEGNGSKAEGVAAHAEGNGSTAGNDYAHAEGNGSKASGVAAHAEGTGTEASSTCAHAEGRSTKATNDCAHAEGTLTLAQGQFSHAEGYNTVAAGHGAHAEGTCMQPPSQGTGIMGPRTVTYDYNNKSFTVKVNGPMADHRGSHAEGAQTLAAAYASHAEGMKTNALADGSHTEGEETTAHGKQSHAEGHKTTAGAKAFRITSIVSKRSRTVVYKVDDPRDKLKELAFGDICSFIFNNNHDLVGTIVEINIGTKEVSIESGPYGDNNDGVLATLTSEDNAETTTKNTLRVPAKPHVGYIDIANFSHSEGTNTLAVGEGSHSEGRDTRAVGKYGHAEGRDTTAVFAAHAEGWSSQALGQSSHAEGGSTITTEQHAHAEGTATGAHAQAAHAEGYETHAYARASHTEGGGTQTSGGGFSHAEGLSTRAGGTAAQAAHAEGWGSEATADASHAEGYYTHATGYASHAEGEYTYATGESAHSEGYATRAEGMYSHAEGNNTVASGKYSHAQGYETVADGDYQTVVGCRNLLNSGSLFSVGAGYTAERIGGRLNRDGANTFRFYDEKEVLRWQWYYSSAYGYVEHFYDSNGNQVALLINGALASYDLDYSYEGALQFINNLKQSAILQLSNDAIFITGEATPYSSIDIYTEFANGSLTLSDFNSTGTWFELFFQDANGVTIDHITDPDGRTFKFSKDVKHIQIYTTNPAAAINITEIELTATSRRDAFSVFDDSIMIGTTRITETQLMNLLSFVSEEEFIFNCGNASTLIN